VLAGSMIRARYLSNKNALAHFMRILYYSSLQTSRMTDGTGKGWWSKGTQSPSATAGAQERAAKRTKQWT